MKLKSIKICPSCKSGNITWDTAAQTGKYRCKDCGYIGPLIIRKDIEPKRKKGKSRKK